MATPEHTPEFDNRLPGSLRGGAVLALHSRQAARLIHGRRQSPSHAAIQGLFGFAGDLRLIHEGCDEHDPYADWWLAKVRTEMSRTERELAGIKGELAELLDPLCGFSIAETHSERPMLVELQFAGKEAYAAARLLANYDVQVLGVLSAEHHGLFDTAVCKERIEGGGRALRRLFLSPVGYQRTGVTLDDVRLDNAQAERAREWMGNLPDEFAHPDCLDVAIRAVSVDAADTDLPNVSVLTAAQ